MSDFETIIRRVEALPGGGEGMTVGAIAELVNSDSGTVVSAIEDIVEREEKRDQGGES